MLRIDLQQHQPRIQALLDPTVLVRLRFKVRPLRDGGGKPSPGRQPPRLRKPPSVLVDLGKKIQALAGPWTTQVFDSIHKQEKAHPFPEDLLQKVRALICPTSSSSCSPGQPFYLEHSQTLAQLAEEYCTTLKHGVPLGVDTPVLRSPDIWPTKEELKGEPSPDLALEAPTGRENYPSAETHSDDIRATFQEEKAMDMVLGPFRSRQQRQLLAVIAWSRNSARVLWQPLTKGTRFVLSMMVHGVEPMLTYRQIVKNALRLLP